MKRDEVLEEMANVAEALEKKGLTDVQIARGRAKYDNLEAELNRIKELEMNPERESVQKHLDKIRQTLSKKS